MTGIVTLRLEPELRARLDALARAQRRSRSFVAAAAIRDYITVNEWQIAETSRALAEADRGEFASAADVKRVAARWSTRNTKRTKPKRPRD